MCVFRQIVATCVHSSAVLTPYMARSKARKEKNLLSASQEEQSLEPEEVNFI